MTRLDIEAFRCERPPSGESLAAVGRATRVVSADGTVEIWSLALSDVALAKRLVSLGAGRLGGFDVGWGSDSAGVFVVRRRPARTFDMLASGESIEGLIALAKIRDLARGLDTAERAGVFPGPLEPKQVAVGDFGGPDAWCVADGYVRALLGETTASAASSTPSTKWMSPEQAAGAPWDNAANRYVLGLVAYRMIAGAHPFARALFRDALRAKEVAPPPFDDALARTLRPGIQSLILSLLDPEAEARPRSAREVLERCEEILQGGLRSPRAETAPQEILVAVRSPKRAPSPPKRTTTFPWPRYAKVAAPVMVGLAALGVGVFSDPKAESPPAPAPTLAKASPLTKTTSATCAPCHARQVAEWQRSVMAHAVKSPLFGALENLIEEEVGRDARCPNGAGILRKASADSCRDERSGVSVTGSGGEHWCVNCHAAGDNLRTTMPGWSANADPAARRPLRDLLSPEAMEGISCAVCHEAIGPVHLAGQTSRGRAAYEGNASWTSFTTGAVFRMRPEDGLGVSGISNSGYLLDPSSFLKSSLGSGKAGDPIVHGVPSREAKSYVASSEFCGACHDVRLFGTDAIGVRERGEHFKRLRNAYSEWRTWADGEKAAGRRAASCQDCHMSLYPGVCVTDDDPGKSPRTASREGCPPGFHFESKKPGERARAMMATSSDAPSAVASHYFTSVELPLSPEFPDKWASDTTLDASGSFLGLEPRRDQLLRHTFRFELGRATRAGGRLEIPIEIENVGAGHRVPAGFSQEREIWVELTVRDARGGVVYQVGRIADDGADLRDKVFLRTTTRDDNVDFKGRPLGVFGADVVDGPDHPRWSPNPSLGGATFRGAGLINMQNGFLRCVRCIGIVNAEGKCDPGPGQGRTRADRFDDGAYDPDTGECRSNLAPANAFFETYFPVGALDADRGLAKAPDAIIDTRSAPPGVVLRYTYDLEAGGRPGPFEVEARLRFRPFPPFLLRAFVDYEARVAARGLRPSGASLVSSMLSRNRVVDLANAKARIE